MPNWKVHLEIGKRLNEKIKYNSDDYNLFLLGNILPDINNSYIVKKISEKICHDYTHFKDINGPFGFYDRFKNQIKSNPIICGYFVHLYTDYTWNNDFYKRIKNTKLNSISADKKRKLKQREFLIYNNKYIHNKLKIIDFEKLKEYSDPIKRISITQEDIFSVIKFLDEQQSYHIKKLDFYNMQQLDRLILKTNEDLIKILDV